MIMNRSLIPSRNPNVVGISDGGYFMFDSVSIKKKRNFFNSINRGFGLQEYVQHYKSCSSSCFIPYNILPYIRTPMFLANSFVDTVQADYIMELDCRVSMTENLQGCSAPELKYLEVYRMAMKDTLYSNLVLQNKYSMHGAWFVTCPAHTILSLPIERGFWDTFKVRGITLKSALYGWYNHTIALQKDSTGVYDSSSWVFFDGKVGKSDCNPLL
jgi:hypothetical protein